MKRLLAVMLLLALPVLAQTAKVVTLQSSDADEAKAAYQNLQDAQKRWDAIQKKVKEAYTETNYVSSDGKKLTKANKGFESGFNFSEDFKSIVPISGTLSSSGGIITFTTPACCGCGTVCIGQ